MHIAQVLSPSLWLTAPWGTLFLSGLHYSCCNTRCCFPTRCRRTLPFHLSSSMWIQRVQHWEQQERVCVHCDRCCGSREYSGCCTDVTNDCTHPCGFVNDYIPSWRGKKMNASCGNWRQMGSTLSQSATLKQCGWQIFWSLASPGKESTNSTR